MAKGKKFEENLEHYEWKMNALPKECKRLVNLRRIQRVIQKKRIVASNVIWQLTGVSGLTIKLSQQIAGDLESALKDIMGKEDKEARRFLYLDHSPEEFGDYLVHELQEFSFLYKSEKKLEGIIDKGMRKTKWYNEVLIPASKGMGIGGCMACDLLWYMVTPSRFKSIGYLFSFASLDVRNGKAPKRTKGKQNKKCIQLLTILRKILDSWIKMSGKKKVEWYDTLNEYKEFYRQKFPEKIKEGGKTKYNPGHIHNMAARKVYRVFLRDFYDIWLAWEYEQREDVSKENMLSSTRLQPSSLEQPTVI